MGVVCLRGLGGSPQGEVKDPHERHPSGFRGCRSSWQRKFEVLRALPRGLQTFRSRSTLQVRVIYLHFSDEETEAEAFLEVGTQVGSQRNFRTQGAWRKQCWELPQAELDQLGGHSQPERPRDTVRLVYVTQPSEFSCSCL